MLADILWKLRDFYKMIRQDWAGYGILAVMCLASFATGIWIMIAYGYAWDYVWPFLTAGLSKNWFCAILSVIGMILWFIFSGFVGIIVRGFLFMKFFEEKLEAFSDKVDDYWKNRKNKPAKEESGEEFIYDKNGMDSEKQDGKDDNCGKYDN
jgi:hypothetical protein